MKLKTFHFKATCLVTDAIACEKLNPGVWKCRFSPDQVVLLVLYVLILSFQNKTKTTQQNAIPSVIVGISTNVMQISVPQFTISYSFCNNILLHSQYTNIYLQIIINVKLTNPPIFKLLRGRGTEGMTQRRKERKSRATNIIA